MKISIVAATNTKTFATKQDWEEFSGHAAGICYMKDNFDVLQAEEKEKTMRRVAQTKQSGHHSVYDHEMVSLYLEDVPKALAMILNNEQMYTTSEKSARYTKMVITKDEQALFSKWLEIFKTKITEKYLDKYPIFFGGNRIEKLAQENARYLLSICTPTSMMYTVSYRQLNYLYGFFIQEINKTTHNKFYELILPAMKEFCKIIENLEYFDKTLTDNGKNRSLSLVAPKDRIYVEDFGDSYTTIYNASFAQLAQAQRHRTLSYTIQLLEKPEFYIPPIIRDDDKLVNEWLQDCQSRASVWPQGMMVKVIERGTIENFINKLKERKCTYAQLEINQQSNQTLNKYVNVLKSKKHPMASQLEDYTKGSRCTFKDYKCTAPCGFKDGINETRII